MARLTKKQLAERERAAIAQALHSTAPAPEPMPPSEDWSVIQSGWAYNAHTLEVIRMYRRNEQCSCHADFRSTTFTREHLYETREQALAALRCEVEMLCAERLRKVDRMLAEGIDHADALAPVDMRVLR